MTGTTRCGDFQSAAYDLTPDIWRSEVESAIGKLRNDKSPGSFGITDETMRRSVSTSFRRCVIKYGES